MTLPKADAERLKALLLPWSERNGVAEPLPAGAADMIPAAMATVERHLAPVTKEALAVLMQRLWDAGIPQPEPVTIAEWMRLLADYPERVLAKAFDEVAKTHRWPSPPKPADIVRHLDADLERVHAWRRLLQRAKVRAELDSAQGQDDQTRQERHQRWLNDRKAQMSPEQLERHERTVAAMKSGASVVDVLAGRI
jgi:hypothetical protein